MEMWIGHAILRTMSMMQTCVILQKWAWRLAKCISCGLVGFYQVLLFKPSSGNPHAAGEFVHIFLIENGQGLLATVCAGFTVYL